MPITNGFQVNGHRLEELLKSWTFIKIVCIFVVVGSIFSSQIKIGTAQQVEQRFPKGGSNQSITSPKDSTLNSYSTALQAKAYNTSKRITTTPLLTIDKDISNNNFSWTDTVQIKINVRNEGNGTAHNIFLTDYYPAGFEISKNQGLFVDENTITYNNTKLAPGESYTISYSMSGKGGMSGDVQISSLPVNVVYSDYVGNQFLAKSDQLKINLHSTLSMADTVSRIAILLTIAFLFGGFGALIHWLTMTTREKKTNRRKICYTSFPTRWNGRRNSTRNS